MWIKYITKNLELKSQHFLIYYVDKKKNYLTTKARAIDFIIVTVGK